MCGIGCVQLILAIYFAYYYRSVYKVERFSIGTERKPQRKNIAINIIHIVLQTSLFYILSELAECQCYLLTFHACMSSYRARPLPLSVATLLVVMIVQVSVQPVTAYNTF